VENGSADHFGGIWCREEILKSGLEMRYLPHKRR
jgi:hypothetical protein